MKTVSESDYKLIIEVLSVFANQAIDSRDTKMLNRQRRVKIILKNYKEILEEKTEKTMDLTQAQTGKQYIVQQIHTDDAELNAFLFSLGCYSGQPITVVSRQKNNCIVLIKQAQISSKALK